MEISAKIDSTLVAHTDRCWSVDWSPDGQFRVQKATFKITIAKFSIIVCPYEKSNCSFCISAIIIGPIVITMKYLSAVITNLIETSFYLHAF